MGLLGNAGTVEIERLQEKYGKLLIENERIQAGFKIIRDTFVFTDKRFIIIDVQGMTGKKIEYQSIPYSKITFYSIETSGHFDLDAELKIWIGSISTPIEKRFNKKANIYEVQRILSQYILI